MRVVLGIRADFYGHCLDHPKLIECLNRNLHNVRLMSPPQLCEATENRLALAGTRAESGLIDALLADVGDEPGNLALVEHALAQLWEKSGGSGRTLTNAAYAEIGRLKRALGKHVDAVYRGLSLRNRSFSSWSSSARARRTLAARVDEGAAAPPGQFSGAVGAMLIFGILPESSEERGGSFADYALGFGGASLSGRRADPRGRAGRLPRTRGSQAPRRRIACRGQGGGPRALPRRSPKSIVRSQTSRDGWRSTGRWRTFPR